jgi:nitrite reductase (NADH) large subunit
MSGISLTVVGLLCAVLLVRPELGLKITWTVFAPALPIVFLVAPSLWRNVCPFAFVNQLPRLGGFTFGRQLPRNVARHAFTVAAVGFVGLVVLRRLVLDSSAPATAATIGAGLVLAFVGGVAIRGKAGWCGTFCPIYAAQRLYGRAPLVQVGHAHCSTCVGCVSPCVDLNPAATAAAESGPSGRAQNQNGRGQNGQSQKVRSQNAGTGPARVSPARTGTMRTHHFLVGAAPGLVVGYFTAPDAPLVAALPVVGTVVAVLGPAVASLCAYLGLYAAVRPAREPVRGTLTSGFVAIAGGLFYVFTVPMVFDTWRWDLPLLVAGLQVLAVAGAAWWWIRDARRGLVIRRPDLRSGVDGSGVVDDARVIQRAQELRMLRDTWRGRVAVPDSPRVTPQNATQDGVQTKVRDAGGDDSRATDSTETAAAEAPGGVDLSVRSVVVVGSGIASLAAADAVRRLHPTCDVHVVGDAKELRRAYDRIAATDPATDAAADPAASNDAKAERDQLTPEWFAERRITAHVGATATRLDLATRQVTLDDGARLAYDRLILATGAVPAERAIQGLPLPGAYSLRTVSQASTIRHHVETHPDLQTAVVVGAGALGIHVAMALAELGREVHLIDRYDWPAGRLVDERAGYLVARRLTELGVHLHLGATVRWANGAREVTSVRVESGVRLPCDVLLLCTGMRPEVDIARAAGLTVRTGVVVDETLRTSDRHVFAVGDAAEPPNGVAGPWYAAVEQAEVAAEQAVVRTPTAAEVRRYLPGPTVTRLDLPELLVVSVGSLGTSNGEQVVVFDDPPLHYIKVLLSPGGSVKGCIVVNDPAGTELLETVAQRGTDVRPYLDLLRTGDVSTFAALVSGKETAKRRRRGRR